MELVRRLVRAINWVYMLYAAAAVSMLYALTTPMVIDPLIGFLLAGIVPGTDIVLAPETLLLILTDIFGIALCVMLIVWLVQGRLSSEVDYQQLAQESGRTADYEANVSRAFRHMLAAAAIHKTAKISTKAARSQAGGTVSVVMRRSSTRAVDSSVKSRMSAIFLAVTTFLNGVFLDILNLVAGAGLMVFRIARLVLFAAVEVVVQACTLLVRMLRLAGRGITWGFVFFIVLLGTVIDWLMRMSAYTWKRSKPGLRQFDRWLEQRYKDVGNILI